MSSDIELAVAQAYDVFARYRIGADLDFAAQVGLYEREHERLRHILTTTPLRDLPRDAIDAYFDYIDAAYYDGTFNADEFRYFLPRALAVVAHEPASTGSSWLRECLDRSFERAAIRARWPADEVQAIDGVFGAPRQEPA